MCDLTAYGPQSSAVAIYKWRNPASRNDSPENVEGFGICRISTWKKYRCRCKGRPGSGAALRHRGRGNYSGTGRPTGEVRTIQTGRLPLRQVEMCLLDFREMSQSFGDDRQCERLREVRSRVKIRESSESDIRSS